MNYKILDNIVNTMPAIEFEGKEYHFVGVERVSEDNMNDYIIDEDDIFRKIDFKNDEGKNFRFFEIK